MIEFDWIARAMAHRYARYLASSYDVEDLMQEARLGIMHGMARWQEGKGASRETWATIWARSYIHRYVRRNINPLLPGTGKDTGIKKNRIVRLPVRDVDDEAFRLRAPDAEQPCEHRLAQAFSELPKRWRYLLTERFAADRTLQSLADERGCKRQAIENVTRRAIGRLRDELCT